MPGVRVLVALTVLVLALTLLLAIAVAVVTVRGARRADRLAQLRGARPDGAEVELDLLRELALELAATRSPADVRRLLPERGLSELRSDALVDLGARDWRRRLRAIRLLIAVGPAEPVLRLLSDDSPVVRAAACGGLGPGSEPDVLHRTAALLADSDAGVRYAAGDALARCGPRAAPALAALIEQSPTESVRAAALTLAAGPGAEALLPHARSAALDESPLVRRAAALALAAVGDPDGQLRSLIADRDAAVAAAACRAAGPLRDAALAAPLAAALRSPAWDVRTAAAGALVALGPPGVLVLRAAAADAHVGAGAGIDAFARDAALAALGLPAAPVPS